jgi:hypothetical protein
MLATNFLPAVTTVWRKVDPPPAFTTGLGRRLARRCLPRIIIITMNIFYRMLLNGMPLRGALVAVALSLVTVAALGALTIRAVPLPHSQLPDVSRLQLELRWGLNRAASDAHGWFGVEMVNEPLRRSNARRPSRHAGRLLDFIRDG